MSFIGPFLAIILVAIGIYYIVSGEISRWLAKAFLGLLALAWFLECLVPQLFLIQLPWGLILGVLILTSKSFWRCLIWAGKRINAEAQNRRKEMQGAQGSRREAIPSGKAPPARQLPEVAQQPSSELVE